MCSTHSSPTPSQLALSSVSATSKLMLYVSLCLHFHLPKQTLFPFLPLSKKEDGRMATNLLDHRLCLLQ